MYKCSFFPDLLRKNSVVAYEISVERFVLNPVGAKMDRNMILINFYFLLIKFCLL